MRIAAQENNRHPIGISKHQARLIDELLSELAKAKAHRSELWHAIRGIDRQARDNRDAMPIFYVGLIEALGRRAIDQEIEAGRVGVEGESMTDLETIRKMFARSGIQFTDEKWDGKPVLSLEVGHKGVTGYHGFGASLVFTKDGKLLEIQLGEG